MIYIGFTGTRRGMTRKQKEGVNFVLDKLMPDKVFHGSCIGADKDFDNICRERGIRRSAYPGKDMYGLSPSRAHCDTEETAPTLPYIVRDKLIVEHGVDGLIACPNSTQEQFRGSGTWLTVRYARKVGRLRYLVYPDGTITTEGGET